MKRIPGENPSYEKAHRKNVDCMHCGCEIYQYVENGRWAHAGRHGYENRYKCESLTVATPKA